MEEEPEDAEGVGIPVIVGIAEEPLDIEETGIPLDSAEEAGVFEGATMLEVSDRERLRDPDSAFEPVGEGAPGPEPEL